MIRAYPRYPSCVPGETLTLHVSTDSPHFRIEFHRQGAILEQMPMASEPLPGSHLPDGPPDLDWGWTPYRWSIPADWPSGAYFAMLIEIAADGSETRPDTTTSFARSAKAMFVVRHGGPVPAGTFLYKISWATFAAYNSTGYGSLYSDALWSRDEPKPGFKVTWRRPGVGTGGTVMAGSPVDVYAPGSDRQTFEHWDAPFVRWLEGNGYAPHYCTDWDVHRNPDLLRPYALLLSVGHDEYWSQSVRMAVSGHVRRGGNVAYLTGNTCFWRIHYTDEDTAITCAKVVPATRESGRLERDSWMEADPETKLIGVSMALGGGWWDGRRKPLGYTVQHAGHWIYDGTGLQEGEVFGDNPDHPLIGYEADGADFRRVEGRALATGEFGTPRDFLILGTAEMGEGWFVSRAGAAATMGIFVSPQGGISFQAATTDWPMLVPRNRHVEAITRNVLDRLRWPAVRIVGPLPCHGGRMLAAAGETVTFHADLAGHDTDGLELAWRVAGGRLVEQRDPLITVEVATERDFLTVSVELRQDGQPVGFGTRSLLPLTVEEAARLAVLIDLHELVLPDDPGSPNATALQDPSERFGAFTPVHLPGLKRRAARLQQSLDRIGQLDWTSADPDG
ncbi:MAG: DUF6605 domain-containing protein [Geminicoccaceae bacterium]